MDVSERNGQASKETAPLVASVGEIPITWYRRIVNQPAFRRWNGYPNMRLHASHQKPVLKVPPCLRLAHSSAAGLEPRPFPRKSWRKRHQDTKFPVNGWVHTLLAVSVARGAVRVPTTAFSTQFWIPGTQLDCRSVRDLALRLPTIGKRMSESPCCK